MTMHLLGPHITTTNYSKRKSKLTQAKMDMYVREYSLRCKRDKKFRLPTISFDDFVNEMQGKPIKTKNNNLYVPTVDTNMNDIRNHRDMYPSSEMANVDINACAKRENMKYTGTYIKGIATMHKSNAVPVTSNEQAEDISRMRRG